MRLALMIVVLVCACSSAFAGRLTQAGKQVMESYQAKLEQDAKDLQKELASDKHSAERKSQLLKQLNATRKLAADLKKGAVDALPVNLLEHKDEAKFRFRRGDVFKAGKYNVRFRSGREAEVKYTFNVPVQSGTIVLYESQSDWIPVYLSGVNTKKLAEDDFIVDRVFYVSRIEGERAVIEPVDE